MSPKITLIIFTVLFASAYAQAQESVKILSTENAKKIAAEARRFAASVNAPHGGPSIAIVDRGGNLLYLERPEGTFAGSAEVAFGKARTAALFEQPTKNFEMRIREGRTPLLSTDFIMLEGGVPIILDGKVIGAIGISGAASSQQDVEIAEAAAKLKLQ